MKLSSKAQFAIVIAAVTTITSPAPAGGPMIGRQPSGGSFARPMARQPAFVSHPLSVQGPGSFQKFSPAEGLQNGNVGGTVRNSPLGTVVPPSVRQNSSLTTKRMDRSNAVDPRLVPRKLQTSEPSRHDGSTSTKPQVPEIPEILNPSPTKLPGIGTQIGNGSIGNPNSPPRLPKTPPGFVNKHIDPLPGERPVGIRPPVPGIPSPGAGPGGGSSGGGNGGGIPGSLPIPQFGGGDSGAGAVADSPADASSTVPTPALTNDSLRPSAAEAVDARAKEALDIELTDVRLVDAGSVERKIGPRYRLFYRNNGNVEAPKFHVSVAVDVGDKLTETAEIVTVEAVGIRPGKSQTVDVRLPVEVLTMAINSEDEPAAFSTLVAVIDSDGDLAEVNTDNNVLVFARETIKSVKQ